LFLKELQAVLYMQNLLDSKDNPWKFQKVIPDRLGNVKTGVTENGTQPDDVRGIFP
jgi:hypothetical protein